MELQGRQRIGSGFDSHRLVRGRPLWIGGVRIPADVGADAHSDGDVLLHAAADALFGAVAAGDIGEHFPDTDPAWKDHGSAHFLLEAARAVDRAGYRLVNLDGTVFLEKIKLSARKDEIARRIVEILAPLWDLPREAVNVKAKTMEGCDAVGRGEALSAQVSVLIERS